MNYKTTTKNTQLGVVARTNVAIDREVYDKAMAYAKTKGMKLNKVVEFAILDYLTKTKTK